MVLPTLPILFQNVAGRVVLDPASRALRVYWSADARALADTQALFGHLAQALQQQGWSRVLINQVAMLPFSPAEQQWVAQHWLPAAVQSGYRYGAVVVAADTFARLATALITTSVGGLPLRYRSFDAEAPALAWLREQP